MKSWNDHDRKLAYADAAPLRELVADCTVIEQGLPQVRRTVRAGVEPSPALVVTDDLAAMAAGMELSLS